MDPLSQGIVGVAATQLVARRREKVAAAVLGFFAGMAADLDVLISSSTDPLLFLEYHRHFTHALVFIPVGALICALAFKLILKRLITNANLSFRRVYLFCFAGYATHALLDACTTYGTQLLWPFSDARVAWNTVSVIDPLFTIPLLVLMWFAVFRRSNRAAAVGAVYALSYLTLGQIQNYRASEAGEQLAIGRGHTPINLSVKPSMANLLVWKTVYEYDGRYYVDAVRVLRDADTITGVSVDKLDVDRHFPWLAESSQQATDIERFAWFSNDHLGLDPSNPMRIIDIRYSLIPNEVTGMWGIVLSEKADQDAHVKWTTNRPKGDKALNKLSELWAMIRGASLDD